MSHVFHRQPRQDHPIAVEGDGIEIIDRAGRRYIDASGGAAVSCLGHSHPRVIAAIKAQLDRLAYAHTSFFTSEPAERLADHLIARAPEGIDRVYYVSGGSEAIEAALKMARQYFLEIGQPQRRHFIARRQSYHGNTLGALAVGGNAWRRRPFEPLLIEVAHVSPCYPYRDRQPEETDQAYVARLAAELEATVQRLGPRDGDRLRRRAGGRRDHGRGAGPAGLLQGGARDLRSPRHALDPRRGDVRHGPHRAPCSPASRTACDRIWSPSPRASAPATSRSARSWSRGAIFEAIRDGSGFFQHGHTYMAHPIACAAALAVQRDDRRGAAARPGPTAGCQAARAVDRALRRSPADRRDPRPRAVPGAGVRRRPGEQTTLRARARG